MEKNDSNIILSMLPIVSIALLVSSIANSIFGSKFIVLFRNKKKSPDMRSAFWFVFLLAWVNIVVVCSICKLERPSSFDNWLTCSESFSTCSVSWETWWFVKLMATKSCLNSSSNGWRENDSWLEFAIILIEIRRYTGLSLSVPLLEFH